MVFGLIFEVKHELITPNHYCCLDIGMFKFGSGIVITQRCQQINKQLATSDSNYVIKSIKLNQLNSYLSDSTNMKVREKREREPNLA